VIAVRDATSCARLADDPPVARRETRGILQMEQERLDSLGNRHGEG
jgi:hypothetical protein